jgi:glycosyltransferase involved in cell wall biosynthesis
MTDNNKHIASRKPELTGFGKPAGSTPAISVLMPCYNASATLDEALESLASQTWVDFEIVAVDDGSTDDTAEKLGTWAQRDKRIRVIHQPHSGIITALNYGLQHCRAETIARMDADDRSLPMRLEKQKNLLDEHPEIGVASCLVAGFPQEQVGEGQRIYIDWLNALVSNAEIRREMFIESPLAHPSVMLRREWLEKAGGYQEHGWAEDYDLWLRLYLLGAAFAKVPEVLVEWRESPKRLTRQDERYSPENFLKAKAHYLVLGPLQGRETLIIWGAGMIGRRLGRLLQSHGAPLAAYIDIDPRKIGRTRRSLPILPPEELPGVWQQYKKPILLAAVGLRGARQLIRQRLVDFGLVEGDDFWCVA